MVLAATNRPNELDEAILRRFPQAFEIGIPDQSERSKILKVILKGENIEENIDYDYIAYHCEGFTGSDIFELCKKAAYFPVRELLQAEKDGEYPNVRMISSLYLDVDYFLVISFWPNGWDNFMLIIILYLITHLLELVGLHLVLIIILIINFVFPCVGEMWEQI